MHTDSLTRRHFLATATAAAATAVTASAQAPAPATAAPAPTGPFKLEDLPYAKDALEPSVDALTMEIHHGRHHKAYVDNLNKAIAAHSDLQKLPLEKLIADIAFLPEDARKAVQNNGGGHWNHTFFWKIMGKAGTPGVGGAVPDSPLGRAIASDLGGFDKLKEKFADAAMKRFGSGWAWLILKKDGKLSVVSTPNQDNPLMQGIVPNIDRGIPIIGLDVWEHAYYLKYQNKRADYIAAWWNVVNWNAAQAAFDAAAGVKPPK